MPTTPTSFFQRLVGGETWTDAVNFGTAAHTFGGAVIFSANPVFSGTPVFGAQALPVPGALTVPIGAATTTLTLTPAAHANRLVTVASTGGLAITPAPATGTGNVYLIAVSATVTGGSLTIDAKAGNASDIFFGNCVMNKVATGITTFGTAANSNLYTANGTTTGGIKGDLIELVDIATNVWAIFVSGQGTGTIATPFSNH